MSTSTDRPYVVLGYTRSFNTSHNHMIVNSAKVDIIDLAMVSGSFADVRAGIETMKKNPLVMGTLVLTKEAYMCISKKMKALEAQYGG
ncbi:hypothetical protein [Acinetobacter rathckeae]|uniref:hypothetical protein n=1 Tax=Acinetobacter rathckeae TaxID=2605272 RepID=UPI0018A26DDA|nr:hypothetical protein [Acinetobacter rathckeae]MBF7695866.1 hypothetical protein [Acinetobacter rathckeae]